MKRWIVAALSLVAASAFAEPASAQAVWGCAAAPDTGAARALCHEVTVPISVSEAWSLWTTNEGLASWLAPVAFIDPVAGGLFETSYERGAQRGDAGNIHNRVVALTPERLLALRIEAAPPGFANLQEARTLVTRIEFEPAGAAETRVRVVMEGYREGAAYDALMAFFERGNAFTLEALHRRATGGPVDWTAVN